LPAAEAPGTEPCENTRKRMRRIDRDPASAADRPRAESSSAQKPGPLHTSSFHSSSGCPACAARAQVGGIQQRYWCGHKTVNLRGQHRQRLGSAAVRRSPVRGSRPQCAVAGLPGERSTYSSRLLPVIDRNFTRSNSGVGRVLRFLQNTPIELHPGVVPPVNSFCFFVVLAIKSVQCACWKSQRFPHRPHPPAATKSHPHRQTHTGRTGSTM